jgi:hypothetical protein
VVSEEGARVEREQQETNNNAKQAALLPHPILLFEWMDGRDRL